MEHIFRTHGITEKLMGELIELNGFHEVTDEVIGDVTQSEWTEIINRYYPGLVKEGGSVSIDLKNEIIRVKN
ncbi:MAG: hypothetical protein AB7G87_01625 [Clostridia bacterium]